MIGKSPKGGVGAGAGRLDPLIDHVLGEWFGTSWQGRRLRVTAAFDGHDGAVAVLAR